MTSEEPAILRLPWPDEVERLRAFLPSMATAGFRRSWPRVLVASNPDRIVGAVCLLERRATDQENPQAPDGHIEWALLPGWRAVGFEDLLLEAACSMGASLRLGRLTASAALDTPFADCLQTRGFLIEDRHEQWTLDPSIPFAEFGESFMRGVERRGLSRPESLRSSHLAEVRRLCGAFSLLPPERVQLRSTDPNGFDPELSFVHCVDKRVGAVLLARHIAGGVYLEAFARYPHLASDEPMAAPFLVCAFLHACTQRGIRELTCIVRPEATPELVPLLRRGGAHQVKQIARFARVSA